MLRAWQRVKSNAGVPGIDGMTVEAFPAFSREHWPRIRSALMEGTYRPAPVLRVFIPKPDGTQRPLGVPTVLDRVIQQALAQVLTPLFESGFISETYSQVVELSEWVRRRVRLYYWTARRAVSIRRMEASAASGNQWKRPRTCLPCRHRQARRRHLLALGIPREEVHRATRSRKGDWRMSANSIVLRAQTNRWLHEQGVPDESRRSSKSEVGYAQIVDYSGASGSKARV